VKGILLAGGRGTRLYPLTVAVCKQLLPVYDKPMIYYPLSVLMLAGVRDILIIGMPDDLPRFRALLGDGSQFGVALSYAPQPEPAGIAEAFLIGASFIGRDAVSLILGDNIFYGHHLTDLLQPCVELQQGGIIFGYEVKDPQRYGVVTFDAQLRVQEIVEKPVRPSSRFAVTGLYFYDNDVVEIARSLRPSARGELEITDVNRAYLQRGDLQLRLLGRGFAWLDTGTHEALHQASSYIQTIQERQGIEIACLEEIAYQKGFITAEQLRRLAVAHARSEYGAYLTALLG
jgi:glucose-1-phosphate thymidylyltransferase